MKVLFGDMLSNYLNFCIKPPFSFKTPFLISSPSLEEEKISPLLFLTRKNRSLISLWMRMMTFWTFSNSEHLGLFYNNNRKITVYSNTLKNRKEKTVM